MMDREKLIKLLANRDGMTIAEVADCILAIIKPSPEPEMWVCKDAKICDVSTKKCEHKTKHKKCESCDYNCCRNNGEGCKCIPYVAEAKKEIMQANHIIVPVGMTEGHSEKHEKNHACGFWGCVPVAEPKEKSYAERQAEWVKANGVKVGGLVRILSQPEGHYFSPLPLSMIGKCYEVNAIYDNSIEVNGCMFLYSDLSPAVKLPEAIDLDHVPSRMGLSKKFNELRDYIEAKGV